MNRQIWKGTIVLTAAAIFVKILSAVYRLPYQNLAGDIGFYVYQQIYPFYALAVVMGGTGFPIIISKLIAEEDSKKSSSPSIFANAFIGLSIMSLIIFAILYGGAPWIASMMSDPHLTRPLKMIAFIYLFVPFLGVLRGFFQGSHDSMSPTALSQIGEQTLRVGIILGLALFLYYNNGTPYQFGTAASFGSMIAPVASVSILLVFFIKYIKRERPVFKMVRLDLNLIKGLLIEGLAFTLLSLTLVAFQFIDAISVVSLLDKYNWSDPKALKGIYDRAYPLIQLGITAAVALTTAIVPSLARVKKSQHTTLLRNQISLSFRISIIFSLAASVGLMLIAPETNLMLYKNSDGTMSLMIMSANILCVSIIVAGAGILQGTEGIWTPIRFLAIAVMCKFILNVFFIPWAGINGAAAATMISSGTAAFLNLYHIYKRFSVCLLQKRQLQQLALALITMIGLILLWKWCAYRLIGLDGDSRGQAAVISLSGVLMGAFIYLIVLIKLGFFTKTDLESLPFATIIKKMKHS
ncbi:PST family polysaccharide transporter [Scopulibacillus darangshiensis]|uniref:PST family polysaccharide transporter n=1 Tax=Scopulibacillus darangshiensis TaxID=442528 RepID=A0A4R2NLU8_9BACL|nr:polysaccharide biosynthesis protein [Scopulibacillus darangshiensis]TCP22540.1 PST family polysaccharide transporter [Scopulibacillus darangshiensis]